MKINSIGKIFNTQFAKIGKKISLISQDTVSFSGDKIRKFSSGKEAYEFYAKEAEKVNESLANDDEITAFELLGYDVDSDFETEKITINGDYKPYFEYKLDNDKSGEIHVIPYKDAKIDEQKLLAKVEKITGKKLVAPSFTPPEDFKIDDSQVYPPAVERKLQKLIEKRAENAKLALEQGDTEKALQHLGFTTQKDENGKITIKDGFSNVLLTRKSSNLDLNDYGLNEEELLKDVVQIKGGAKFSWDYMPDHYIKIDDVKNWGWNEKAKKLALMNPSLIAEVNQNKEKLAQGDNFSVLKSLGYDVEKTDLGKIKINGHISDYLHFEEAGFKPTISFEELGYDINALLKNVSLINGDLSLYKSKPTEVDKDLIITGTLWGLSEEDQYQLFKNHISNRDLYAKYDQINPKIIDTFVSEKVIIPAIRSNSAYFFKELDNKTTEFLTNIVNNKETLLDAQKISEKYGVSLLMIKNAMGKGTLHPYAIEDSYYRFMRTEETKNYLFDISDERNAEAIKHFSRTQKKAENESKEVEFYTACAKNEVKLQEKTGALIGTEIYTFGDIERFGYGSKDDLIAHCDLLVNAYAVRKHLYEHDTIKISHPTIKSVMELSRKCNPSLVKLSDLEKLIGEDFRKMVIDGKFSIITSTIFEKLPRNKYCINLSDEKNMQALKSVKSEKVQKWLAEKQSEINYYKAVSKAKVEEFKHSKPPTKEEALKEYETKKFQAELRNVLKADDERLAKKRRAFETRRNLSLRTTIAWVLSPNTKDAQKEKVNPTVKEILERHEEIREINNLVLAGEMTVEDAKIKIQELKLSKEEEISVLSFYKSAWELAGTEEWIEALKQAKEIAEAYKQGGLDAVVNNEVKDRLSVWEKKWGQQIV